MANELFTPIGLIEKRVIRIQGLGASRKEVADAIVLRVLLWQMMILGKGTAEGSNLLREVDGIKYLIEASIHRRLQEVALPPQLVDITQATVLRGYRVEASCRVIRPDLEIASLQVILAPDAHALTLSHGNQLTLLEGYGVVGVSSLEPHALGAEMRRIMSTVKTATIVDLN